jgi:hypothetical protein
MFPHPAPASSRRSARSPSSDSLAYLSSSSRKDQVEVGGCCRALFAPAAREAKGRRGLRERIFGHSGIKLLKALDGELKDHLADGSIKLVRADYVHTLSHVVRRQELERRERGKERVFVPASKAVALLATGTRQIGVLTYGWTTPDDPDITGAYLAAVQRFLLSDDGAHITAIFWDYLSLPRAHTAHALPPCTLLTADGAALRRCSVCVRQVAAAKAALGR